MSNSITTNPGNTLGNTANAGGLRPTSASLSSIDMSTWLGAADEQAALITINPTSDMRSMNPAQLAERVLSHL